MDPTKMSLEFYRDAKCGRVALIGFLKGFGMGLTDNEINDKDFIVKVQ